MKLGINRKTGQTWSLRSRLARDLPVPGVQSRMGPQGTPIDHSAKRGGLLEKWGLERKPI